MFDLFQDQKVRQRRKKFGGNGKKNYTEGWVEFLDKKVAKVVANMLNAKPIGKLVLELGGNL